MQAKEPSGIKRAPPGEGQLSRETASAASMFQELKFQLSTAILTILTLAAAVSACINLDGQYHFRLPEDGVIWVDRAGGVQALEVPAGSPGRRAGIHNGDWLTGIDGVHVRQAHRCHPSAGPARRLAECHLRGGTGRCRGHHQQPDRGRGAARPGRDLPVPGGLRVPDYRPVRLFPPRQRAKGPALLYSLPGVVHLFLLPLHRQAQQLRQGDLFRQRGRRVACAHPVPAFLPDLPRAAQGIPPPRPTRSALPARGAVVSGLCRRQFPGHPGEHAAAGGPLAAGPGVDAVLDGALSCRGVAAPPGIVAGGRSHRAPAAQMAAQRHSLRHPAVRPVLRAAVCRRGHPEHVPEDVGAVGGAGSADAGLRHRALPADGRGHHFPPRLRLHAGYNLRAGGLLRAGVFAGQPGAEDSGPRQHRA